MSELKTNKISTNDQNNVAIDNALGLKSYTTAQRDALTSVAGDMIYNSDDNKIQYYNGTAWTDTGSAEVTADFLVIAGGGAGGAHGGGGGGAGGYRSSWNNETSGGGGSSEDSLTLKVGTTYTVTVGAGGAQASVYSAMWGNAGHSDMTAGSNSVFASITSIGGGVGHSYPAGAASRNGGSGGGGGTGTANQGFDGGSNGGGGSQGSGGGGGGGAGEAGNTDGQGEGGDGVASTITGSSVTRGGGGGGGRDDYFNSGTRSGGAGGGGQGRSNNQGLNGSANYGGGGGGGGTNSINTSWRGGAGGSGVVILRYPTASGTLLLSSGISSTSTTVGSDTVVTITAGTGTATFGVSE